MNLKAYALSTSRHAEARCYMPLTIMHLNPLAGVRCVVLALFAFLSAGVGFASDSINIIPELHGVIRGRWEVETHDGYSRFQVRNARLSVRGKVAPVISYLVQADFCDRGKFNMLDAYVTLTPGAGWQIKAGQYRMPFGYDSHRGPANYLFNNRSAIGRYVNNYRAVGIDGGYTLPSMPLTFEAGIFNPTTISDHTQWVKKYAYACRALHRPDNWLFAAGFESIRPDRVRINLASATVGVRLDRFYAEGEYMVRTYTSGAASTTHAYNVFATYGIPLPRSVFDTWSFQARVDGMTDLASGVGDLDSDGHLPVTEDGRTRLTLGTTLDYKYKSVTAAIRLNYEKFRYDKNHVAERGTGDKVSVKLVVSF